jgi:hypothetical protein
VTRLMEEKAKPSRPSEAAVSVNEEETFCADSTAWESTVTSPIDTVSMKTSPEEPEPSA